MLGKLTSLIETGAALASIKARMTAQAMRRAGGAAAMIAVAVALSFVALLGLLATLAVALWEPLGPAGALGLTSLVAVLIAFFASLTAWRMLVSVEAPYEHGELRDAERRAASRLRHESQPSPRPAAGTEVIIREDGRRSRTRSDESAAAISSAAAFAALSILGPRRAVSLARKGAAAAAAAAAMADAVSSRRSADRDD